MLVVAGEALVHLEAAVKKTASHTFQIIGSFEDFLQSMLPLVPCTKTCSHRPAETGEPGESVTFEDRRQWLDKGSIGGSGVLKDGGDLFDLFVDILIVFTVEVGKSEALSL